MIQQIYYNPNGSDPLEIAKDNTDFFKSFVKDFGSSIANQDLWPAENLRFLIREMKIQEKNLVHKAGRKMAAKLIRQYKDIYQTLIKQ